MDNTTNHFVFSDKWYWLAKKLVQIFIPAVSSLYFGLDAIWGLPKTEQVIGTLALLATFIGSLIHVSSKQYDASGAGMDGNFIVNHTENGPKVVTLDLSKDPEVLTKKDTIVFKVKHTKAQPPVGD